jgi:hypothetical protein
MLLSSLLLAATVNPPVPLQADLVLGDKVKHRQVQPLEYPDWIEAGQTVVAWSEVSGPGGGFVEHVWYRNGEEVAHHYLPLGTRAHSHTWSRHKLELGDYRIEVLAPDGKRLREISFTAQEPILD